MHNLILKNVNNNQPPKKKQQIKKKKQTKTNKKRTTTTKPNSNKNSGHVNISFNFFANKINTQIMC